MRSLKPAIAAAPPSIVMSLAPAFAQAGDAVGGAIYSQSLAALTVLLVTAVLLESAFATIFNWRVFLTYFSARGVKTIVMIAVALLVVHYFRLDVFASLIAVYTLAAAGGDAAAIAAADGGAGSDALSKTLTALILAGGSAGVYNVMTALGFRQRQENAVEAKPPLNEAWIAIRVTRRNAVGEIRVIVDEAKATAAADVPPAIAGTVGLRRPSLGELLLRNRNRFPSSGGYVVKPNVPYTIAVEGQDQNRTAIRGLGERKYVFAAGAIVDFDVIL